MVGYKCTNHVQGILGDTMKFEDIKVGMKVINKHSNGRLNGEVGTVFDCVSSSKIIVKYEVPTDSPHNEDYNEKGLWSSNPAYLEPFTDPEEDLIVWGALEAGEKFQAEGISSITYLKLNDRYYVVLGSSLQQLWSRPSHWKVRLVN
ncbi:hypothetical protein [Proteus phage vB_PmiP_RS8pmA]|uniref:Uncharacterized protein n=1 Tax=Proteus phage vB_PmiP_RS8pmA TaxID=2250314 RepID=A0A514CY95_9CAUD|nr:hypothetical protein [Proteus phage vB_PmiP_RS8pmA]